MGEPTYILLTGATGFLGRWLLRDLLATGRRVAVLVRAGEVTAEERVRKLLAGWGGRLPPCYPRPVVLAGDLRDPSLGLSAADRDWINRRCRRVVHAAADVSFRTRRDGEPWVTNVDGTARLLELGVPEFHHVSTAFVCGDRPGPVGEEELDAGQRFRTDYERSKFEAERRVRAAGTCVAVYRPSVIVGDSQTGATTSYHGLYQFLQAAQRLAASGRVVCLPFTGDEPRNLVPVDWVARAIVRLVDRPAWHGRTFHLVSRLPVSVHGIKRAADERLGTSRLRLRRPGEQGGVEEVFVRLVREYAPYLDGDPEFDCRNTLAALPDLPAPAMDQPMLARLIRFALADDWGRRIVEEPPLVDAAEYIERFLPEAARRSVMRDLPLDVAVGLDVAGAGRWLCRWADGELIEVRCGSCRGADVVFRTDHPTFGAVVRNSLSPQDAFLTRRLHLDGDVERGLKLAVLFAELVREFPFDSPLVEAKDGVACPG
jgi:thioester reductase-like protein